MGKGNAVKINNLNVDADAIGRGLYGIICDKGESALVSFGMIPKWIMDIAEKMVREKIVSEAAKQVCCSPEELAPIVDKAIVDDMTNKIMRQIGTSIYKAASEQGQMIA